MPGKSLILAIMLLIETDDECTYFLIDIPCHPNFVSEAVELNDSGVKVAQKTGIKFWTLQRYISQLQSIGVIIRKGGRKEGYWEICNTRQVPDTFMPCAELPNDEKKNHLS